MIFRDGSHPSYIFSNSVVCPSCGAAIENPCLSETCLKRILLAEKILPLAIEAVCLAAVRSAAGRFDLAVFAEEICK